MIATIIKQTQIETKGCYEMSKSKINVPQAKEALNQFKMEAAKKLDVPLHIKIKACET